MGPCLVHVLGVRQLVALAPEVLPEPCLQPGRLDAGGLCLAVSRGQVVSLPLRHCCNAEVVELLQNPPPLGEETSNELLDLPVDNVLQSLNHPSREVVTGLALGGKEVTQDLGDVRARQDRRHLPGEALLEG